MRHHQVFLFANIFFILGVGIRSFFHLDIFLLYLFGLLCVILLCVFKNFKLRLLMIGGVFLFFGVLRYQSSIPEKLENILSSYNGNNMKIIGVVCNEIDERISNNKITVCAQRARQGNMEKSVEGKVLVTSRLYPRYSYGDTLHIQGKLLSPEPFDGFSYDRYLARYDIYSIMYYPKIEVLEQKEKNDMFGRILNFKKYLTDMVSKSVPEPEASLLNAIVLGKRGAMPKNIQDQMAQSGIIHLIAISGSHISLIIILFMGIAPYFYLSRNRSFYIITVLLIFYIILIGAPPSAVRSAIMGWLVIFAMKHGRLSDSGSAIIFSAAVMLLHNPLILRDDIGFQLSFLSVWGIITLIPIFERWESAYNFIPSIFGFREIIFMTIASYIATLPLTIFYFGRISLISIIANLLTVPIFLPLMISMFICYALYVVAPLIGPFIFFVPYALIAYLIKAGEFFSRLPFSSFLVPEIPFEIVIVCYALMILLIYRKKFFKKYV